MAARKIRNKHFPSIQIASIKYYKRALIDFITKAKGDEEYSHGRTRSQIYNKFRYLDEINHKMIMSYLEEMVREGLIKVTFRKKPGISCGRRSLIYFIQGLPQTIED